MSSPPVSFNDNQATNNNMLSTKEVYAIDNQVAHIRAAAAEQLSNLNGDQRTPEVLAALINAHARLAVAQIGSNAAIAVIDHSMAAAKKMAELN